jgi:thymidylate synthase ThyX
MISAKIVADSLYQDHRITSYVLTYPRFILAEVNTHRALVKNTASSRAIPIKKMIQDVRDNPAMPIYWGKNQSGMQAEEELPLEAQAECKAIWIEAAESAIKHAERLMEKKCHKQITNRLLEPFFYVRTLLTGTEFENFFALRTDAAAQPEFRALATLMLREYCTHEPERVKCGDWHIPFGDRFAHGLTMEQKLKIATARAARVSYMTFDGEIDYEKDYSLHDSLIESGHVSPTEHSAQAVGENMNSGCFVGWIPYRKTLPKEQENHKFDYNEYCRQNNLEEMYWV